MQLVSHSDRVFSIASFLSNDDCAQLIALVESVGFSAAGVRTTQGSKSMPFVRNNERAIFEHEAWVNALWSRLLNVALPTVQNERACGLPKDLRFYKYSQGQRFKMHKDGPWTERGLTSQLTFLIYLNEAFVGGETNFRDVKVLPKTGTALLFIHDTWHEGAAVTEGVKYVLRSDVLYGPAAGV